MTTTWHVKAELQTSLAIVQQDNLRAAGPMHPTMRHMTLTPGLTDDGQPTGILEVTADIELDDGEAAFDVARDVIGRLTDVAAMLTAAPAVVVKGPTAVTDDPSDPTKHTTVIPGTMKLLYEPVPLLSTDLFRQAIRPELRRIMAWYRRGISEEQDVVASLASLFTALDLLGNEFECATKRSRKCPHCRKESEIKPGTTDKNRNLLESVAKIHPDAMSAVLKARERVVHGGIDLTSRDIRDLEGVRVHLSVALIRGLKRALHLSESEPPPEGYPNLPFSDPVLTVEYRDPPESAD